jgi:hypothetical protein
MNRLVRLVAAPYNVALESILVDGLAITPDDAKDALQELVQIGYLRKKKGTNGMSYRIIGKRGKYDKKKRRMVCS